MPSIAIVVAVGAALGVALVVYGIVASNREAGLESGVGARVTYRTLADVREQLRRRFEPTGAPVWVAGPNTNALARDLASADLQLRPYEFRLLQVGAGVALALLAFLRCNVSFAVPVAAVIEHARPPVSEEFGLARREIELGASVESALANIEKRMGSSDLRLMIMVVTIQHAVGGDLPAILTTLADTMRQRREMRQEVLAATAQSRASAVIITLLPLAVAAFGYFVIPDYFRPLFTNFLGWVILFFAALLLGTGTFIIRRITAVQ